MTSVQRSRRFILLAGLSSLLWAIPASHVQAFSRHHATYRLVVLSFAGRIAQIQRETLFTPYIRLTHHLITIRGKNGSLDVLRQQEARRYSLVGASMLETSSLHIVCSSGLLVLLSASYEAKPPISIDYAITWNRSQLNTHYDWVPDWADFWNIAYYPGRRSLRKDSRMTLEVVLLADGVLLDRLYRVLATTEGVNRAFEKLDQIRPYITWWLTSEEAWRILTSNIVY